MNPPPLVVEGRAVSRETSERLAGYESLVRKWNPAINLVGKSTLDDFERRHILDSAQLFNLGPRAATSWLDLGSGGGLPGLVIAILAAEFRPALRVTLVESDQRKAEFLRAAARNLALPVTILAERAEQMAPQAAEILSARALAPLTRLLAFAERHLAPTGQAIFPKGADSQAELTAALESWRFTYQKVPSATDPASVVFVIGGIARV